MPSASGVYSLPSGYLATTGTTIQASQHNPPLEDIAAALTGRLSRDGTAAMLGGLKAVSGTAALPGYTFSADTTLGLFKSTNGVGVAVAGLQVAEFGPSGLILTGLISTSTLQDKAVTLAKLYHPSAASRLLGTNANAALTITGAASNGGPNLIRLLVASSATFTTGQKKTVSDVVGTVEANGTWTITVIDATHIDLQGSVFTNAWVSGGTIGGAVDEIKIGAGLSWSGDTISATLNATLVPNYKSGLTLSTAGGSGTMSIAAGVANDSTNTTLMSLAAFTKTTASWAAGTGNGGLDTGAIANGTWYHFYEISTAAGLTDIVFSATATPLAGPTTLPATYTLFRRIGAAKTDGSAHWTLFTQTGNQFIWSVSVADVNAVTTTTGRVLKALASVPIGLVTTALVRASMSPTASGAILFTSPQESDQSASTIADIIVSSAAGATGTANLARLVDTSAQVGIRATTVSNNYSVWTYGWIDTFGQ